MHVAPHVQYFSPSVSSLDRFARHVCQDCEHKLVAGRRGWQFLFHCQFIHFVILSLSRILCERPVHYTTRRKSGMYEAHPSLGKEAGPKISMHGRSSATPEVLSSFPRVLYITSKVKREIRTKLAARHKVIMNMPLLLWGGLAPLFFLFLSPFAQSKRQIFPISQNLATECHLGVLGSPFCDTSVEWRKLSSKYRFKLQIAAQVVVLNKR